MFRATAKPIHAKTELKHTERGIAITADLRPFVTHTGLTVKTALFLFVIVTHSSSMKGPRLNFHAERELAHPKTTSFHYFSNYSTPTYVVVLFVVNQRSKLHTYSAEVPVLHTPEEVRFSITCRFVDGQGKRGNGAARYVIRNQPHDVHDRSHMMWYVTRGMMIKKNVLLVRKIPDRPSV